MNDFADLSFLTESESSLTQQFLQHGYVCLPVENQVLLNNLRQKLAEFAANQLNIGCPEDTDKFLNQIHEYIRPDDLNAFRLGVINEISNLPGFNQAYFHLAKKALATLVGNELVMQRGIGLSVQLPKDDSSILNVHADTWSGDSPYEVVVWLPLVDCYKTKSMYLLPPEPAAELSDHFSEVNTTSNEALFRDIEKDVEFIEIPYGHFLLFNQNLPHGNRVNEESDSRWSMNRRFKSVFSPYADKKFGEFFEPITLRAATRVGMNYQYPRVEL